MMTSTLTTTAEHDARDKDVSGHVGATYAVGEHYWLDERSLYGYAPHAYHGHGVHLDARRSPGSIDRGDFVVVKAQRGPIAIVEVVRPTGIVPYGAMAPTGAVFEIDTDTLRLWTVQSEKHNGMDEARRAVMRELYPQSTGPDVSLP